MGDGAADQAAPPPIGPFGDAHPDPHVAVAWLLARYADLIDQGDLTGVAALLGDAVVRAPDGTEIARGESSAEALYRSTTRLHPDGTPRTQHLITNVAVDADPDDAYRVVATSRFTVLQAVDGLPLQPIIAGRYRDTLAWSGGRWRFVERIMAPDLFGDLSQHLLIDLPDPSS